jgi:hypothetical protein
MDRYGGDEQPVDDEVAFWRGFIAWWMREKAAPVPPRAWNALALAEARPRPVRRAAPGVAVSGQKSRYDRVHAPLWPLEARDNGTENRRDVMSPQPPAPSSGGH